MNYTEMVAEYVHESSGQKYDSGSVEAAQYCILDWISTVFSGLEEMGTRKVFDLKQHFGDAEQCSILGSSGKFPLLMAPLVNGASASALDYDDIVSYEPGHVTATVVTSCFSLGEYERVTGIGFINAIICGIQVMNSIGAAIMPRHYRIGWHNTSTMGHFGSAAGCASILNLDIPQARNALGIVASNVSGTHENFGTMTKPFHSGKAAMNGLLSVLLARKGFDASDSILDNGFLEKYSPEVERAKIEEMLKGDFLVKSVRFKEFPCGVATHPAILAVKRLMCSRSFALEEIERIEAHVYPNAYQCAAIRYPKTGLEGKFSIYFCIAYTFLYGDVDAQTFSNSAVNEERVRKLIEKIELIENKEYQESRSTKIILKTKSGKECAEEVNMVEELSNKSVQKDLVMNKVDKVLGDFMKEDRIRELKDIVFSLADIDDVNVLAEKLRDL